MGKRKKRLRKLSVYCEILEGLAHRARSATRMEQDAIKQATEDFGKHPRRHLKTSAHGAENGQSRELVAAG